MNEREIAYYNYVNRINTSMQSMLDIYYLQQQTIMSQNHNGASYVPAYNYANQYFVPALNINQQNQDNQQQYYQQNYQQNNTEGSSYIGEAGQDDGNQDRHEHRNERHDGDRNEQADEDEDAVFEREFAEYIDNLVNENVTSELFCNIDNPINRICPITQETFRSYDRVGIINHCKHVFNYDAINRWIRENYICPMCRHDIRGNLEDRNFQHLTINEVMQRINSFLNSSNSENRNRSLVIRYHLPRQQASQPHDDNHNRADDHDNDDDDNDGDHDNNSGDDH